MTFEQRVAILAHIGWGAFLTLALGLWFHDIPTIALPVLGMAVVKESLESLGWAHWEPGKPPWSNAIEDVGQFAIGIVAAVILILIRYPH